MLFLSILHFFILARKRTKAKEYRPRNQWKGAELLMSKFLAEK